MSTAWHSGLDIWSTDNPINQTPWPRTLTGRQPTSPSATEDRKLLKPPIRKSATPKPMRANRVTKRPSGGSSTSLAGHPHPPSPSNDGASSAADIRHKRVWKACERCRMKKIKCDGGLPCKRCKDDGLICTAASRRRTEYKQIPPGYAEVLENSQVALVATVHRLYNMLRTNTPWTFGEPELSDRGQPVVHDISLRLGCIRANADVDLPVSASIPEGQDDMAKLVRQLEEMKNKGQQQQQQEEQLNNARPLSQAGGGRSQGFLHPSSHGRRPRRHTDQESTSSHSYDDGETQHADRASSEDSDLDQDNLSWPLYPASDGHAQPGSRSISMPTVPDIVAPPTAASFSGGGGLDPSFRATTTTTPYNSAWAASTFGNCGNNNNQHHQRPSSSSLDINAPPLAVLDPSDAHRCYSAQRQQHAGFGPSLAACGDYLTTPHSSGLWNNSPIYLNTGGLTPAMFATDQPDAMLSLPPGIDAHDTMMFNGATTCYDNVMSTRAEL